MTKTDDTNPAAGGPFERPVGRLMPEMPMHDAAYPVCKHPLLVLPPFDAEAARDMDSFEVRRRWPRSVQTCPNCRESVMQYASFDHYLAGDW